MRIAEAVLAAIRTTGEPDALKGARPVRRKAAGNVLRNKGTPAAYPTLIIGTAYTASQKPSS